MLGLYQFEECMSSLKLITIKVPAKPNTLIQGIKVPVPSVGEYRSLELSCIGLLWLQSRGSPSMVQRPSVTPGNMYECRFSGLNQICSTRNSGDGAQQSNWTDPLLDSDHAQIWDPMIWESLPQSWLDNGASEIQLLGFHLTDFGESLDIRIFQSSKGDFQEHPRWISAVVGTCWNAYIPFLLGWEGRSGRHAQFGTTPTWPFATIKTCFPLENMTFIYQPQEIALMGLFLDRMNIHSKWFVLKVVFNAIFVQQM